MIQVIRHSPDTCACVYDFSYDDAVTPRVYDAVAIIRACPVHRSIALPAFMAAIRTDNQLLNRVRGLIANVDELVDRFVDMNGTDATRLKQGVEYSWRLTPPPNRYLEIAMTGIPADKRSRLAAALSARFGNSVALV